MQTAIALKDLNPVIADNLTASLNEDNFRTLADVFHVLMDNMDEEVENRLLTELKLKKV